MRMLSIFTHARRVAATVIAISAVTLIAAPQAVPGKVQFEVASVRPITPEFGPNSAVTAGVRVDGVQFRASLPLRAFVGIAWKAGRLEAPEWMASQWYEIAATLPEGHTKGNDVLEMLQELLIERFNLKIHRETKDVPVYALTVTKNGIGAKEDPLDPVGRSAESVSTSLETSTVSRLARGATLAIGEDRIEAKKFTMAMLAGQLTGFMDRPVVDRTGLEADAAYDFTLEMTHEDFLASRVRGALASGNTPAPDAMKLLENSGDSLRTALAQVGLRLEAARAPMEVLVIDSVNRAPGEN
jgi:uncharacterized protein (TIGR03435 family)